MDWFISRMYGGLAVLLALFSLPLYACTVCGVAAEESRLAFILTTGILTFVPLILIGGIVFLLWRKVVRGQQTVGNPSTTEEVL